MIQPSNTPQTNFQVMLFTWIIIIVVIIATSLIVGGQVYWWQHSKAEQEKQELIRQITLLQNELLFLREDLGKAAQKRKVPGRTVTKDTVFKETIAGLENQAVLALKNRDLKRLAKLCHPEKGIRFSPYAFIDQSKDRVFDREALLSLFVKNNRITWGYNEDTGLAIRLTPQDYFEKYVYDRDYAAASEISYNETIGRSLTASNIFEVYPRAIIVEYNSQDNKEENSDWRSLRLVFEKSSDNWFLVGVVHDQWTLE